MHGEMYFNRDIIREESEDRVLNATSMLFMSDLLSREFE